MNADSFRLYQYGDKFKLVYYKTGNQPRLKKGYLESFARFYEENVYFIPYLKRFTVDERIDLYEYAYDCHRKLSKLKHFVSSPPSDEERLSQSISRTRSRIFELAICNDFQFFCTFTLSSDKRDRFDLKNFSKDFGQFIRNFNRNRKDGSKVKYLIIPEKHQDGAWHAHGLIQGLTSDDLIINEHGYYDWTAYSKRFGFISLSPIRDTSACSVYITKYITKDVLKSNREAFGHLYFASQGLNGKTLIQSGFGSDTAFFKDFDFENDYLKISWFDTADDVCEFFNE